MSLSELIIDIPAEYEMNVFGQFDTYIKKIERTFHVTLISRDGATKIVGDTIAAQKAQRVLTQLVELAKRGNTITEQNVDYAISLVFEDQEEAQMKMFLTRIGFGSKVVITGDSTQKDLPSGTISGLDVAVKVVKDLEGINICTLTSKDVVRHPLVQKIVKAYEDYEKKSSRPRENRRKKG